MQLLIANPRKKSKARKSRRTSRRRMSAAQRKFFMPKKSRRRRSRRRVASRTTPRRTTIVRSARRRRSGGGGGASFNLKTIAKQGAVAGGGIIASQMIVAKFGDKLGLNTPMKSIVGQAAIGAGLGYVVAKYAKMPWAGVAIAIGAVAVGVATYYNARKAGGVSGLGAVHQWAADRIESGASRGDVSGMGETQYFSAGMGELREDPQSIRLAV